MSTPDASSYEVYSYPSDWISYFSFLVGSGVRGIDGSHCVNSSNVISVPFLHVFDHFLSSQLFFSSCSESSKPTSEWRKQPALILPPSKQRPATGPLPTGLPSRRPSAGTSIWLCFFRTRGCNAFYATSPVCYILTVELCCCWWFLVLSQFEGMTHQFFHQMFLWLWHCLFSTFMLTLSC